MTKNSRTFLGLSRTFKTFSRTFSDSNARMQGVLNAKYFEIYHHCCLFCTPSKFINYPGSSFSSTFQDLKLSFSGLSRTKLIFQDFKGPGKCRGKIQDFTGCVGTVCWKSVPRTWCSNRKGSVTNPWTCLRYLTLWYVFSFFYPIRR